MAESANDLEHLSRLLERHLGRSVDSAPPPLLQAGTPVMMAAMVLIRRRERVRGFMAGE